MEQERQAGMLAAAIQSRLREGRLTCADTFALAHEHHVTPAEVAALADSQAVRIGWCQLGLFTGPKAHGEMRAIAPLEVPERVRAALEAALEEGKLPCARAWAAARQVGWERQEIGRAADVLGLHISRCQLGCFD